MLLLQEKKNVMHTIRKADFGVSNGFRHADAGRREAVLSGLAAMVASFEDAIRFASFSGKRTLRFKGRLVAPSDSCQISG